ncbi:hypothetical protein ONZ45_g4096 [Pleurotus djamor]|nr:hypothetical protein ONZ45_g4096 [Pleurotus djamor]
MSSSQQRDDLPTPPPTLPVIPTDAPTSPPTTATPTLNTSTPTPEGIIDELDKPLTRNWAKGARLEFLVDNLDSYIESASRDRNASRTTLNRIVNDYFAKFSWRLPLTVDPPPPSTSSAQRQSSPPPEILTKAESDRKGIVIKKMRNAIANWLNYRANKISNPYKHLKNLDNSDPYAILLSRLTGIGLKNPNRIKGWQELQKTAWESYKVEFDAKVEAENIKKTHIATARNRFIQKKFQELTESDQAMWEQRATERHAKEVNAKMEQMNRLDSFTPHERQDAIRRLGDFFIPILEGASTVLKMHVSVLIGGPEPANGGALNVLSIHSGVNRAAIPMTWGEANPDAFDEVTNNFLSYLETCYTAEEKAQAALPNTSAASGNTRLVRPKATRAPADEIDEIASPRPSKKKVPQSSRQRKTARNATNSEEDSATTTSSESPPPPRRHSKKGRQQSPRRRKNREDDNDDSSNWSSDIEDDTEVHRQNKRNRRRKRQHSPTTPKRLRKSRTSQQEHDERPPLKKTRATRSTRDQPSSDEESPSSSIRTPRPRPNPPVSPPPQVPLGTFACPTSARNNSPAHLHAPPVNPEWPSWFTSNYTPLLELPKMSLTWQTVLATYVQLEEQTDFDNPGAQISLPADHRPGPIYWWISRGRDSTRRQQVVIKNLDDYAEAWWRWWKTMQPGWRNVESVPGGLSTTHRMFDLSVSEAPDAWDKLNKHGANGFLSVVASLGWWGRDLGKLYPRWNDWSLVDPQGRDWDLAATDAIWVMQRLHASRLAAC